MQLDLFPTANSARRVQLDATSWIEHLPRWLTDHEALFHEVLEKAAWEQRERWMYTKWVTEPRLTAEYQVLEEAPMQRLRQIAEQLSETYMQPYTGFWINRYRDHNDGTAWHGDRVTRDEVTVPVLSLGASRRFLLRPRAGGKTLSFTMPGGDLLVMGGRCQRDWLHAVPKQTQPASTRISVNFMSRGVVQRDEGDEK